MRNYHFTATGHFSVTSGWTEDTHKLVRRTLTNCLYTLFQTQLEDRVLNRTTTSERRALVAFRHWYLRMRRNETQSPFVYVNVNTGKSIVVTVDNSKTLLVDPRLLPWENVNFAFTLPRHGV